MAVTVAPGRTPPLVSVTVPLICAVAWAHATVANTRTRTLPNPIRNTRVIRTLLRRQAPPRDILVVWAIRLRPLSAGPRPPGHPSLTVRALLPRGPRAGDRSRPCAPASRSGAARCPANPRPPRRAGRRAQSCPGSGNGDRHGYPPQYRSLRPAPRPVPGSTALRP